MFKTRMEETIDNTIKVLVAVSVVSLVAVVGLLVVLVVSPSYNMYKKSCSADGFKGCRLGNKEVGSQKLFLSDKCGGLFHVAIIVRRNAR